MKYNKLIIATSILLAMGCKKVIEIKETDIIAGDVALQTVENCESGVIGAYAQLSVDMDYLMNAVLSDEVKAGEFYNAATVHEWQFSSSDVTIRDNFTAITGLGIINDRVNRVLRALPDADSLRLADSTVYRNQLKGEALFLRAYAHFQLFRYYCNNYNATGLGMPYMESPSLDPVARIDMGTYFTKLKADLATAKPLVPNFTATSSRTRVNKATVSALQARVALYMKEWANAETFATEYINQLPLATGAAFTGIWSDANQEEQAFYLVKPSTAARLGSLWKNPNTAAGFPQVTWFASTEMFDAFDKVNDIRFAAYLKDEPLLANAGRNSKLVAKYKGGAYASATENIANAKVFRTGEMVLIRAEARAEQDKFTGANSAESDVNMLRTARINGYTPVTFTSKDEAITAVMNERFKELAYEGHRFWDLKRRGLPVERIPADAPSTISATLPAGNFRFTLPIPMTEIQANKLMEQNPNY